MRKYRNPTYPALGWGAVIIAAALLILFSGAATSDSPDFIGVGFCTAFILFAWRGFVRAGILAAEDQLVVRNIVRTHRIPWRYVTGFRGEDLLVVELTNEREIRCWAVQRARIAKLFNRRGYMDGVIEALEERRKAAGSED